MNEARRAARSQALILLLLAPAAAVLIAFYLTPLAQVVWLSFQKPAWSLTHYVNVVEDGTNAVVLLRTFGLAIEVTLICLALGYPLAYLIAKSSERTRNLLILVIVSSLWMSTLVRSYAWIVILGREGLINTALQMTGFTQAPVKLLYNRFAVHVGMVHIMLPFMILPLYSVMQRIDRRLVTAAGSLGAGPCAAFLLVFVPLSLPGVLAGCLLVLILSLGFFVTPAILGGLGDITYVMLIERYVNQLVKWEMAAAMSVVLLVVTVALVAVYQRVLAAEGAGSAVAKGGPRWLLRATIAVAARISQARALLAAGAGSRQRRDGGRRPLPVAAMLGWSVAAFLVAPVTIIFPLSFSSASFLQFPPPGYSLRWYETYLGRADWMGPTLTSFKVAIVVMVLATVIGLLAAIPIARGRFHGKRLMMGFLLSPMIVPSIVLAVAYYFFFAQLRMIGTATGLVLAHLVLALPYVVVVINGALESVDESLERAARTLGANPTRAFVRITLPLISPAVLTAALFSFLASFDELIVALFISGTAAKTLPKRLWDGIREEIDPTTAAVAALLTVLSLVLLLGAEWMRARQQRLRLRSASVEGLMR